MRMSNMGTEQRAKQLARWACIQCCLLNAHIYDLQATNRDISEKIALGLAKPTCRKSPCSTPGLQSRISLQLFRRRRILQPL